MEGVGLKDRLDVCALQSNVTKRTSQPIRYIKRAPEALCCVLQAAFVVGELWALKDATS